MRAEVLRLLFCTVPTGLSAGGLSRVSGMPLPSVELALRELESEGAAACRVARSGAWPSKFGTAGEQGEGAAAWRGGAAPQWLELGQQQVPSLWLGEPHGRC